MDERLRHERLVLLILKGTDAFKSLLKWSAVAFVAYQAQLSISNLAGKTTISDIAISMWLSSSNRELVCLSSALLSLLWGLFERQLRMKKVKQLSSRVVFLEQKIDENRSSSNLTPTGQTRPEDQ